MSDSESEDDSEDDQYLHGPIDPDHHPSNVRGSRDVQASEDEDDDEEGTQTSSSHYTLVH